MMPSCDQPGVPFHFPSSTTSGSASLMSLRTLPRVVPRQSPSSAILFEMSVGADESWFARDSFMSSSSAVRRSPRSLDAEQPGVFGVQPRPAELHGVAPDDAAQGRVGEE